MQVVPRQRSFNARAPKDPVYIAGLRRAMRLRAVIDALRISPQVGTQPQGELTEATQPLYSGLLVHQLLLAFGPIGLKCPARRRSHRRAVRARRGEAPFACQRKRKLTVTLVILPHCDVRF